APGEPNQYLVQAAPHSVDFARLGTVHLDLGYAVGVTLPDGHRIGFRYEPPAPSPATASNEAAMLMLLGGLLFVLGHFALFAAIFRHARTFHAERTIFLYHLISAVAMAIVAAAIAMWDVSLLIGAIGLLSIHAIYSLTFLELWSLAESGYSLAILRELSGPRERGRLQSDSMRTLGVGKVRTRI